MGGCAFVLGHKKPAAHRRVGVLQIVFWLSGQYTQDLSFVHSMRKFQILCTWTLDIEISHTEGNHGYANVCYIAIFKYSYGEQKIEKFELEVLSVGILGTGFCFQGSN